MMKNTKKKVIGAILGVAGLALLSACSSPNPNAEPSALPTQDTGTLFLDVSDRTDYEQDITGEESEDAISEAPFAILNDTSRSFEFVYGGSGSCPPLVTSAVYLVDSQKVSISLDDGMSEGKMCTMDYRLYQQTISLPIDNFYAFSDPVDFEVLVPEVIGGAGN